MSAKLKEFGSINSFTEESIFSQQNDLKNPIISISGFGDLICFGINRRLIVATVNCLYNSSNTASGVTFTLSSQEDICDDYNSGEYITSILVLPISSLKQSSQGLPDWTCICVGLSSGQLKFFNQFGQLVFSQKIHSSQIVNISLRGSSRHNQSEIFYEDLMILCDSCCFEIGGIYLYESLNNFKKQLVRFQAGFLDDQWNSYELVVKKWLFDSHESVNGIVFGHEASDTIVDNIFNNVTNKGPFLAISDETVKYINCVIVGKTPFIGFYKLPLESDSLDMGDLAHAVYSKVKGALSTSISSWMGSFTSSGKSKEPVQKSTSKIPEPTSSELPTRWVNRHSIVEASRQASMIVGCPHRNKRSKLAALTDDFGRIFLLDIDDGIVLRIWKGYREAQISISMTSDGSSTERSVNFLVIYAPRRSLIEVWTLPFGEKVASFDVRDRNGTLLHVPHSSLGFQSAQIINQKRKNVHSTFFLDSSGKISVFDIPFHLSLSSSSNERSQDHLVLKHFKNVLRNYSTKSDSLAIKTEFSSSLRRLKLCCSIELLMHSVLYSTYLPFDMIIAVIEELLDFLSAGQTLSAPQSDIRRLKTSWTGIKSLIQCYHQLMDIKSTKIISSDTQNLGDLLNLENNECERIINLFKYYSLYNKTTRSTNNDSTYLLFVNNFTMLPNSSEEEVEGFQLSKDSLEKDIYKIGHILFNQCVHEEQPVEDIINLLINQLKVDRSSCFRLCLGYLINEGPSVLMENLNRVKELLVGILSPSSVLKTESQNNFRLIKTSLLLSNELIEKSSNIMTSLLIAMVIRVIILDFLQKDSLSDEETRIQLTEYLSSWNELCQRLEDLTIFDCFLKCCPISDGDEKSKKVKVSFDRELILFHVLENGKGVFSERFAKWSLKWDLRFSHINELYKSLASTPQTADPMIEKSLLNIEIKDIFAVLYRQLPHSLEYESVLINIAWEYTRLWSKSIQRVEYLERACDLLENIGSACGLVIQGIGSMIWDMHIVVGLTVLFPSDKAASHEYSSHLAYDVTVNVIRLLKMLIKALDNVDVIPTFSTEPVWRGDKSRSSLIDMAVNKELITKSALDLHIQLLYSIQLSTMLDLTNSSYQSLFSRETRKHIFKSLTNSVVRDLLISDTAQCKSFRMKFLENCIHNCVRKFNEETGKNNLCQNINVIVKTVAKKWLIDLDDILQCWIQNYYIFGLDSQGSMYLDKVENLPLLGISLLRIVGSRIKKEYLLPETKYYRECSKYVTPELRRWLHLLEDKLLKEVMITSLDSSAVLLDQILEWIPENCSEFEAGTCLQSVILNIQRTKKYL